MDIEVEIKDELEGKSTRVSMLWVLIWSRRFRVRVIKDFGQLIVLLSSRSWNYNLCSSHRTSKATPRPENAWWNSGVHNGAWATSNLQPKLIVRISWEWVCRNFTFYVCLHWLMGLEIYTMIVHAPCGKTHPGILCLNRLAKCNFL